MMYFRAQTSAATAVTSSTIGNVSQTPSTPERPRERKQDRRHGDHAAQQRKDKPLHGLIRCAEKRCRDHVHAREQGNL